MKSEGFSELIFFLIMIIFCIFLGDCVFNDYEDTKAHQFLEQKGISQRIDQFENKLNQ